MPAPPAHGHYTGVMVPWVKMIEEKSGGRLKIAEVLKRPVDVGLYAAPLLTFMNQKRGAVGRRRAGLTEAAGPRARGRPRG